MSKDNTHGQDGTPLAARSGSVIPENILAMMKAQFAAPWRQDAESPGKPRRQIVVDDGPWAGTLVAVCEFEMEAELIVALWNWALSPNATPSATEAGQ